MFDINVDIPKETVENFRAACSRYVSELGNTQGVAIRRGVIAFVRSIRARTKKAKDHLPNRAITRYNGDGPKYITPKGKKQKPQPRWQVRRRDQTPRHTYVKHRAGVDDLAAAREKFGKITRWGLARTSWGLFMTHLFNRANPEDKNPAAKVKSGLTEGYIREYLTGSNPRVEALLVNSLDYIRAASPDDAIEEAMIRATNSINKQIDKKVSEGLK